MHTTVALNQLRRTEKNMRKGDVAVDDLVANFRTRIARGLPPLMHNLSVHEIARAKKAKGPADYGVHAGDRRFRALLAVAELGELAEDYAVPVQIAPEAEALDESVTENELREEPHLADRYEQFAKLADQGVSAEEIALRYDWTAKRVSQVLKLARVEPSLMAMFRAGTIKYEQVCALTLTDDHADQLAAIKVEGTERLRNPLQIREFLENSVIGADKPLAKFVGQDAYRAAGGAVAADLFAQQEGVLFTDRGLLNRLAEQKLDEVAQDLAAEGWAWTEPMLSFPYAEASNYLRVYPSRVALSAEDQAALSDLQARVSDLIEADDESEQHAEEIATLEQEIEAIEAKEEAYDPDALEFAGVVVTIDTYGDLRIERGMVRPEDIKGYREMEAAKAPPVDGTGKATDTKKRADGLSGALVENLTAHRTLAMRAEVFNQPHVARVLLLHSLLVQTHYDQRNDSKRVLTLSIPNSYQGDAVMRHGDDLKDSAAIALADERRAKVAEGLPEDFNDLFAYLLAQSADRLDALTTLAVEPLIYGVQHAQYAQCDVAVFEQTADAVNLDPSKTWAPTTANYFGRVSGALIKSAVAEVDPAEALALDGLKKGQMAEKAEALLGRLGWLPPVMRSHKPKEAPEGVSGSDEPEEGASPAGEGSEGADEPLKVAAE